MEFIHPSQLYVINLGFCSWFLIKFSKDETNFVLNDGFPTCFFRGGMTYFYSSHHLISYSYCNIFQGIFGMNVDVINGTGGPITSYLALALPLTIVTAWIIIAFQSENIFPPGTSFVKRLGWPVFFMSMVLKKRQRVARNLQPDYSSMV